MPTKDEAWRTELAQAARDANITFDSVRLVSNGAHAGVMIALLRAFGQDPATVLYAEPRTPDRGWNRNARPTDALVLHPELGALFVEVKSWTIDEIEGIEAGTIYRSAGGHQEAKDPWQQAHDAAQQLQHATRNVVNRRGLLDRSIPFFECVVAFQTFLARHGGKEVSTKPFTMLKFSSRKIWRSHCHCARGLHR